MSITSPDVISMPNGSARRSVDQDRHRGVGAPSIQADQDCGGICFYRHTGQSAPLPEGRGTCRTSIMGGRGEEGSSVWPDGKAARTMGTPLPDRHCYQAGNGCDDQLPARQPPRRSKTPYLLDHPETDMGLTVCSISCLTIGPPDGDPDSLRPG